MIKTLLFWMVVREEADGGLKGCGPAEDIATKAASGEVGGEGGAFRGVVNYAGLAESGY